MSAAIARYPLLLPSKGVRKLRRKNSNIPMRCSDPVCTLAEAQARCFVLSLTASSKAATGFLQNKGLAANQKYQIYPWAAAQASHYTTVNEHRADAMQPCKPSNMSFTSQLNSAPHVLVSSPETSNLYSQVTWQCTNQILTLVKSVVLLKGLISQK